MSTPYIEPQPSPGHQCINAACGCDDLVSAGPCAEFCAEHAIERADLESGKASLSACDCGHPLCQERQRERSAGEPATSTNR